MSKSVSDKQKVLDAIRNVVKTVVGRRPTRQEFVAQSGMKVSDIFRHFPNWPEALSAAGFEFEPYHAKVKEEDLLKDWGELVRKHHRIPTRNQYKLEGNYSPGVFERCFGPWSWVPDKFRDFALDKSEWADVMTLLPVPASKRIPGVDSRMASDNPTETSSSVALHQQRHSKLNDRPTYGDPIDFRGLRHEPVNEDGVVFLFGMVARELGYLVEAVQAGFPDCEAKRQIQPGKWQRVRIDSSLRVETFVTMVILKTVAT